MDPRNWNWCGASHLKKIELRAGQLMVSNQHGIYLDCVAIDSKWSLYHPKWIFSSRVLKSEFTMKATRNWLVTNGNQCWNQLMIINELLRFNRNGVILWNLLCDSLCCVGRSTQINSRRTGHEIVYIIRTKNSHGYGDQAVCKINLRNLKCRWPQFLHSPIPYCSYSTIYLDFVGKMPSQLVTRKPPAHFSPVSAKDEQLSQAHYPPRPNPILAPKEHAQWQHIATRKPVYIEPGLVEVEGGLIEANNWAGGVLYASPRAAQSNPTSPKDPFTEVQGSWFVPKAHPVKAKGSDQYQDGQYRLWTWVGIDGWTNKSSLKSGLTSALTVENGKITSETTNAALLFQDSDTDIHFQAFTNFQVDPGDLITSDVWITSDQGKVTGHAWIYNQGRNEYSTAAIEGLPLEGVTAQWIAAGRNPESAQPYEFPNFGATLFFDGLATHKSGKESSLERSELIDAQDLGSFSTRADDQVLVFANIPFKPPPK